MGILYDAPNNIITVTGYTLGAPCTFEAVYQADLAGGWGVVSKQGTIQYCFSCKLYIGDGSIATWFKDKNVQVVFTPAVTYILRVMNNAHFTLGVLDNAGDKTTSQGVSLMSTNPANHVFIYGHSGAEINFFASQIGGVGSGRSELMRIYGKIYSTIFTNLNRIRDGIVDLYDFTLLNGIYGLQIFSASTIEDIKIFETQRAAVLTNGLTIRNLVVRNCTDTLCVDGISADVYMIDCDIDSWLFSWWGVNTATVQRQYTFNLLVKDSAGDPLDGATVTLTDKDDNEMFSVATGGDGKIGEQTVSRGYYDQTNDDTLQDYGPFELKIIEGDREYIIPNIVLEDPVDWTVMLPDVVTGKQGSILVTPRLGKRRVQW